MFVHLLTSAICLYTSINLIFFCVSILMHLLFSEYFSCCFRCLMYSITILVLFSIKTTILNKPLSLKLDQAYVTNPNLCTEFEHVFPALIFRHSSSRMVVFTAPSVLWLLAVKEEVWLCTCWEYKKQFLIKVLTNCFNNRQAYSTYIK